MDTYLTLPDVTRELSLADSLAVLGRTATTLIKTPAHYPLHKAIENTYRATPHPVQEHISDQDALFSGESYQSRYNYSLGKIALMSALLIQFSDHTDIAQYITPTPYEQINTLHTSVAHQAIRLQRPLSLGEQYQQAQDITGEIDTSLYLLFLTSRMHARNLDTSIITDFPGTLSLQRRQCETWRASIAAIKPHSTHQAQDPAGDTYYAWTHALAHRTFASDHLSQKCAQKIFQNGTSLMHTFVHSYNPQSIPNSHRKAASYGISIANMIESHSHTSENF